MQIWLRRAYEKPGGKDGFRVLVDRLWPRGVSKESLKLDAWLKEIAPSSALRRWFDHDPRKWSDFKRRYRAELNDSFEGRKALETLKSRAQKGRLTLVYASREKTYNNAVALKEILENRIAEKNDRE
ncbi:MAG: hypothetical protein PWP34_79 [Desulfuromonadales bacterium]|jgi:uncharacterized protein YeaO (DUF488 family)|nr:hypothetical protein [Desulfuromonadales bacterium]